jgi:hypothetical protein
LTAKLLHRLKREAAQVNEQGFQVAIGRHDCGRGEGSRGPGLLLLENQLLFALAHAALEEPDDG